MDSASVATHQRHSLATWDDLLAIPEGDRFHELLDGELVRRELSDEEQRLTELVQIRLADFQGCGHGLTRPGGWWIITEPTVYLSGYQAVCPDVAGWLHEHMTERPIGCPFVQRPDWVCEIHMQGHDPRRDWLQKRRIYAEHAIPHYWLLDVERQSLTVLCLVDGTYLEVAEWGRGATIRAEPFDALDLRMDALLGDEADEP